MNLFRYKIRALCITHDTLTPLLWEQLNGYCDVIPPPGTSCDESALLAYITSTVPDVVVLQLTSDVAIRCRQIRQIRALSPHTHVVIIAERDTPSVISSALQAGAIGYMYRDDIETRLIDALQCAMQERGTLDAAVATEILTYFQINYIHVMTLTGREQRILWAIAQGATYAEIAQYEHISITVVHNHIGNIILKMGQSTIEPTYAAMMPYAANDIRPAPMISRIWQPAAMKSCSPFQPSAHLFIVALYASVLRELKLLRLRHTLLWR